MSFKQQQPLQQQQQIATTSTSAALARKKRREKMIFSRSSSNSSITNVMRPNEIILSHNAPLTSSTMTTASPSSSTSNHVSTVQQMTMSDQRQTQTQPKEVKDTVQAVPPKKRKFHLNDLPPNKPTVMVPAMPLIRLNQQKTQQQMNVKYTNMHASFNDIPNTSFQANTITTSNTHNMIRHISAPITTNNNFAALSTTLTCSTIVSDQSCNNNSFEKNISEQNKSPLISNARPALSMNSKRTLPSITTTTTIKPLSSVPLPVQSEPELALTSTLKPTIIATTTQTQASLKRKRSKKAVSATEIAKAKEIRMLRNRASAAAHRQRNRDLIETLQKEVEHWKSKYDLAMNRQRVLELELEHMKRERENERGGCERADGQHGITANMDERGQQQVMEKQYVEQFVENKPLIKEEENQVNTEDEKLIPGNNPNEKIKRGPVWKKIIGVWSS